MTQRDVAIKMISKKSLKGKEDMKRLNWEVQIMKVLRHPYLIHLYEIYEDNENIYFVIE